MAQYPNLANCDLPSYPCPSYEDVADVSSDEDDSGPFVLEGFMYDDHGQLVPVCEDAPTTSPSDITPICPTLPPSSPPCSPPNLNASKVRPIPSSIRGKKEIVLPKDANGKLGIKITRFGPRVFLSYVEKNSNAAKYGLGFGDQILDIKGLEIAKMSGSKLMQVMSCASFKEFKMTVLMRPFDFNIFGRVDAQSNLQYYTVQGKFIGSVKIQRVAKSGYIKHLKLLGINNEIVFACKEMELLTKLTQCTGKQVSLRVMPASLYVHLMRKQCKEKVKDLMQLSPRIL